MVTVKTEAPGPLRDTPKIGRALLRSLLKASHGAARTRGRGMRLYFFTREQRVDRRSLKWRGQKAEADTWARGVCREMSSSFPFIKWSLGRGFLLFLVPGTTHLGLLMDAVWSM